LSDKVEIIKHETSCNSAFLSAATGGYLYYSSLQQSAFQEAERQALTHAELIKKNLASFLFGKGPWNWIGLEIKENKYARDQSGNKYLMRRLNLYNYPGWDLVHLYNLKAISKIISGPLIKITGPIVLALCILVGLAVFLLYRVGFDSQYLSVHSGFHLPVLNPAIYSGAPQRQMKNDNYLSVCTL